MTALPIALGALHTPNADDEDDDLETSSREGICPFPIRRVRGFVTRVPGTWETSEKQLQNPNMYIVAANPVNRRNWNFPSDFMRRRGRVGRVARPGS